ncbi:NAD(P)-dependent dehydrogenase, short-chain alcohol dehydrogenase family [Lentzea fradiae]|uniref:NAD(P)-dependent dehydrogenase, short-chain alcohol dehydrogenase family n=1 Tax=Lentzea fradiae TaxID=200378 RepID=A0A1G7L520_9PSEU|nr:SDR family oxidoreductase [Lentzea fradiae]SDF44099.1 NAD(P)-dependent dehydrogenase, short-chain alcohol dehydrogenase family [Lentzea fradiae]
MGKLDGKLAVITGGSAGLGLATARRFVSEGAQVLLTARRAAPLDAAVSELGPAATGVLGDVTDTDDLNRLRAAAESHGRGVDVLFANAGSGRFAPFHTTTPETFDEDIASTLRSTYFTVQVLLPLLNPGASVILMSSAAGSAGAPGLSVYGAGKAGIRSLARNLAVELGDRQIRVNVVSPGYINTHPENAETVAYQEENAAGIPLRRVGQPDEVATAVLFLASGDSSYITGSELFIDGGRNQV